MNIRNIPLKSVMNILTWNYKPLSLSSIQEDLQLLPEENHSY